MSASVSDLSELDVRRLEEVGLGPAAGNEAEPPSRFRLGFLPRFRSWLWHHRYSLPIVSVLLAGIGAVQGIGMTRSPVPMDDEGTYVAQAWAVQTQHRLAHYTYWYDHPPLGWIQISLWTWLTDGFHRTAHAVMAGRQLMLIAGLLSAALVFVICRRLGLPRWAATVATLLFGLSPLAVTFHRMVLLDNISVAWLLAAFALALSPRRSLWASAASGLCFAVAVLSKETFLLFLPALIWQLWQQCDRRTRPFCVTAFSTVLLFGLIAYPLFALLKGELVPGRGHVSLIDALRFQLVSRASSGNVLHAATPAHHTVTGWLAIDPWLVLVGVALIPLGLFVVRLRPITVALLIQVLMLARGGYLPGPFVVGVLPFAALVIAGLATTAWGDRHVTRAGAIAVARRIAIGVLAVLVIGLIGGRWYRSDRGQMTANSSVNWAAAEQWVDQRVPRNQRVIVDDTMWVDLVEHGFPSDLGVVWFYKLDSSNNLDPSVARRLPRGWQEFDYIVSTPTLRSSVRDLPNGLMPVRQAMTNSTPVAHFGSGDNLVEVRKINRGKP